MALSALTKQASRLAPRVPAVANASAPQARVAIQRLYGCGAMMMASSSSRAVRRRNLAGRDATDQAVDGRQPAEVDRPGLHDVQRGGCRRGRSAVGGDVDRRADDVDLAPLDAVRVDDGRDLVHRGRRRHPGRHQDGADVPGHDPAPRRPVRGRRRRAPRLVDSVIRGRVPVGGSVSLTIRLNTSRRRSRHGWPARSRVNSTALPSLATPSDSLMRNEHGSTDVPSVAPEQSVFSLTLSE